MKRLESLLDIRCVTVLIAADLLGISRGLCYRLIHEGQIPAVRLGRRLLVPVKALNAMLDEYRGEVLSLCPDASERPPTVMVQSTDATTGDGQPLSG